MSNSTSLLRKSTNLSIVKSTKLILNDLDSIFQYTMAFTLHSSLWYNPRLKLNRSTTFWNTSIKAGIFYLKDIYRDNTLSFQELQLFKIKSTDSYKYELLCNSILDSFHNNFPQNATSDLAVYIQTLASSSHAVSHFYKKLNGSTNDNIIFLTSFWNKELDIVLFLDVWRKIWLNNISGWLPVSIYQTNTFILFNCLRTPFTLFKAK